jgi:hypothetical protein
LAGAAEQSGGALDAVALEAGVSASVVCTWHSWPRLNFGTEDWATWLSKAKVLTNDFLAIKL